MNDDIEQRLRDDAGVVSRRIAGRATPPAPLDSHRSAWLVPVSAGVVVAAIGAFVVVDRCRNDRRDTITPANPAATMVSSAPDPADGASDAVQAERARAQIEHVVLTVNGDLQQDRDAVYFDRQWRHYVDVQTCIEATGQEFPLVPVTYFLQPIDVLQFDWWSELDPAKAANGFGYNIVGHRTEANPAGVPGYQSMSAEQQNAIEQLIARCGGATGPSSDDPYPEATSLARLLLDALYIEVHSDEFEQAVEAPYRQCMDDAGLNIDWQAGLPDFVESTINQSYYDAQLSPGQPGSEALDQQNKDFEIGIAQAYVTCRTPLLPQAMELLEPVLDTFLADHADDVEVVRAGWAERGDVARADMAELEAADRD